MNIKEYISSGILELYVLGQTSAQESQEVEKNAGQYPEIADELEALQIALLSFNQTVAKAPPPHLEQKILDSIKGRSSGQTAHGNNSSPYLWIGLLALALAGMGYFYQQNQRSTAALASLQSDFAKLKKDCEAVQNHFAKQNKYIAVVGDTGDRAVAMEGQETVPGAFGVVHWNPKKRQAFLEIKNLPDPPPGKQYQLWAIVDGQPTDMGVFDIERGEMVLQELPFIAAPQAFAVTLEKAGGSAVPTLDQMVMIGNI